MTGRPLQVLTVSLLAPLPALLCSGLHPHAIVTSYKCQSDLSQPSRHIWNTIWRLGRGGWGSWPWHLCPRCPDHLSSSQALSPIGRPLLGLGSLHLPSLHRHVLPWTITRPARIQCSGLGSGGTYLGRPFLTHCVKHTPHPSLYHFVCLVVAGFTTTYYLSSPLEVILCKKRVIVCHNAPGHLYLEQCWHVVGSQDIHFGFKKA